MREFVLVKNKSGEGNRLLRVDRIIDVEDTEEGAVISYRRLGDDSAFPLKTASTAAEVLAAIEGAQDSAPVLGGQNGGLRWHHSGAINLDRQDGLVGVNASIAYRETDSGPGQYSIGLGSSEPVDLEDYRPSPNFLALTALANRLAMELENQTGVRWGLSIQRLENSVAFFRCSPAKSAQHFDTKTFCHVALEDESEEALAKMAGEMAVMVLASWRLRGL